MKKLLSVCLIVTMLVISLAGCAAQTAPAPAAPEAPAPEAAAPEAAAPEAAQASTPDIAWPEKPITFISGSPAGSAYDVMARKLITYMEKDLGVTCIIENRGGSSNTLAMQAVLDSEPDGYTFLLTNTSSFAGNYVLGVAPWHWSVFDPVSIFGVNPGDTVVVRADAPYDTLEEFVAYSKENGPILAAATQGGGLFVTITQLINEGADIQIMDAPSNAERISAVVGGHADMTMVTYTDARDYIETDQLKALAVIRTERVPAFPDVPPITEIYPDVGYDTNWVCFAPKGTPQEICEKLNAAFYHVAMENEEFRQWEMETDGVESEALDIPGTIENLDNIFARFEKVRPLLNK